MFGGLPRELRRTSAKVARMSAGVWRRSADSGKQAHYLFCRVNSKGERGPWKMAFATVTSELQIGV